jgi:prepilin-type N-terminal cleavage/methylation domain-containing protein
MKRPEYNADKGRGSSRARRSGFTLIELLVALAVLSMLAVAVSNLFSHSTKAWDTGTRRAQTMLVGRALMDYFVRETGLALCDPAGSGLFSPGASGFIILPAVAELNPPNLEYPFDARAYALNELFGNTAALSAYPDAPSFNGGTSGYPLRARFRLVVESEDRGRQEQTLFTGRTFLWNRNRYRFD